MQEKFKDYYPRPFAYSHFAIDIRPDNNMSKSYIRPDLDFLNVIGPRLETDAITQSKEPELAKKELQLGSAALHISNLRGAMSHLSHHEIARRQQMFTRQNFERVADDDYVNHAKALESGVTSLVANELRKNKKAYNDVESAEDDAVLSPHDYDSQNGNGITSKNIFVKGSKAYEHFEKSQMNEFLSSEFQSPLRLLGSDMFQSVQADVSAIQEGTVSLELPDMYSDNDVSELHIKENVDSILQEQEYWNAWAPSESFSFLTNMHAQRKGFYKTVRTFSGFMKEQNHIVENEIALRNADDFHQGLVSNFSTDIKALITQVDEDISRNQEELVGVFLTDEQIDAHGESIKKIEDLWKTSEFEWDNFSLEQQDELNAYYDDFNELLSIVEELELERESIEQDSTAFVDDWWENIGRHLDDGVLTPFGLLAEQALDISTAMDFGLAKDSNDASQDKLLDDYVTHLDSSVFSQLQSSPEVDVDDLMGDDPERGLDIMNTLIDQGVIDREGKVNDFDPADITKNWGFTAEENELVYSVLNEAHQGLFSFDSFDVTQVNGAKRQPIHIIDPEGNEKSLKDIISAIDLAAPSHEQYTAARDNYNLYMDMMLSMAGTNFSENGQLTPEITETEDGFKVAVYPHATWNEKEVTATHVVATGDDIELVNETEWTEVEDAPLEITFESQEEAEDFFESIRNLVLYLEPVVSNYNPVDSDVVDQFGTYYDTDGNKVEGPLRLLVDNSGDYNGSEIISKDSEDFRYNIDYLPHQAFFKSQYWDTIKTKLGQEISLKIGTGIFSDSIMRRLEGNNNKRRMSKWREDKKQWEEEKEEEKRADAKSRGRRRADRKRYENSVTKQRNEMQKILKSIREKEAARMKKKKEARKAEEKRVSNKGKK